MKLYWKVFTVFMAFNTWSYGFPYDIAIHEIVAAYSPVINGQRCHRKFAYDPATNHWITTPVNGGNSKQNSFLNPNDNAITCNPNQKQGCIQLSTGSTVKRTYLAIRDGIVYSTDRSDDVCTQFQKTITKVNGKTITQYILASKDCYEESDNEKCLAIDEDGHHLIGGICDDLPVFTTLDNCESCFYERVGVGVSVAEGVCNVS